MCRELYGNRLETLTLGVCSAPCNNRYLSRSEAMDLVRKNQPAVKCPAIQRLEAEVARQLNMTVVFFTAVRSALDEFHSIDGFFQIGKSAVTIDLTDNPAKFFGKADVVFQADEFEDLPKLAGRIVSFYRSKSGSGQGSGSARKTYVWRAA